MRFSDVFLTAILLAYVAAGVGVFVYLLERLT